MMRTASAMWAEFSKKAQFAVGLGVAVAPAWQRRGVATQLTTFALAHAREQGRDLALALLLPDSPAAHLLASFGFSPLDAELSFTTPDGLKTPETAPCWALWLNKGAASGPRNGRPSLNLGEGPW